MSQTSKAKISFQKNHNPIECELNENLMFELLRNEIPVASSCFGEGVCAKCRVQIIEGANHLSAVSAHEEFLQKKFQLQSDERISCQTQVLGDIKIDTKYW